MKTSLLSASIIMSICSASVFGSGLASIEPSAMPPERSGHVITAWAGQHKPRRRRRVPKGQTTPPPALPPGGGPAASGAKTSPVTPAASPVKPNSGGLSKNSGAVSELIDRYQKAVGDPDSGGNGLTLIGRISIQDQGEGEWQQVWVSPDRMASIAKIDGKGETSRVIDGKEGWVVHSDGGAEHLRPQGVEEVRLTASLLDPKSLRPLIPYMHLQGSKIVEGRQTSVVSVESPLGPEEVLYFDQETGLLDRRETTLLASNGKIVVTTDFQDYQLAGSVRVPFYVRQSYGGKSLTIRISEAETVAKEDGRFEFPGGESSVVSHQKVAAAPTAGPAKKGRPAEDGVAWDGGTIPAMHKPAAKALPAARPPSTGNGGTKSAPAKASKSTPNSPVKKAKG